MSAQIGYTLAALREMHQGACETDIRLVWKMGDMMHLSTWSPSQDELVRLADFCGSRELRLFAMQLLAFADEYDRKYAPDPHEVVVP